MTKICPRCREALIADLDFFAPRDRNGRLDGWCRACRSEDQRARYSRRKMQRAAVCLTATPAVERLPKRS